LGLSEGAMPQFESCLDVLSGGVLCALSSRMTAHTALGKGDHSHPFGYATGS